MILYPPWWIASVFLDGSSSWHFKKTKMRRKGQGSPTLPKPDAERYVDIVDPGQTQAVTVPDPPDCVTPEATAAARLALPLPLNCPGFSSWTKRRLTATPPALLARARLHQNHAGFTHVCRSGARLSQPLFWRWHFGCLPVIVSLTVHDSQCFQPLAS